VNATASPYALARDGLTVALRVSPRASRNRIEGVAEKADGGAELRVAVTAAPEGGKANAAVIALLAKAWRVPKGRFSIAAGASGRRKVLHVAGDGAALLRRIAEGSGGR
jgi:uncharacterized protein (TIGR00251 family)